MREEADRNSGWTLITPDRYGLPVRTVLMRHTRGDIALVMDRKSRIIMADGRRILEKAQAVRRVDPGATVVLRTSAPLCSKTRAFLGENGIDVERLESDTEKSEK